MGIARNDDSARGPRPLLRSPCPVPLRLSAPAWAGVCRSTAMEGARLHGASRSLAPTDGAFLPQAVYGPGGHRTGAHPGRSAPAVQPVGGLRAVVSRPAYGAPLQNAGRGICYRKDAGPVLQLCQSVNGPGNAIAVAIAGRICKDTTQPEVGNGVAPLTHGPAIGQSVPAPRHWPRLFWPGERDGQGSPVRRPVGQGA